MRYWRPFSVFFLLTFTITGCHRRPVPVSPPPQAQAPIITSLPPLPSLMLHPVLLAEPMLAPPTPSVPQPAAPTEKPPEQIRRRRVERRPVPDTTAPESRPSSAEDATGAEQPSGSSATVGMLSADDSATNPDQTTQTRNLIRYTEDRLKSVSPQRQEQHKDTVAQIGSFLAQARQALSTNDQVGAQTLANKAKILVDELLK